jgi:hypothetical protein
VKRSLGKEIFANPVQIHSVHMLTTSNGKEEESNKSMESATVYTDAADYWSNIEASDNGMF